MDDYFFSYICDISSIVFCATIIAFAYIIPNTDCCGGTCIFMFMFIVIGGLCAIPISAFIMLARYLDGDDVPYMSFLWEVYLIGAAHLGEFIFTKKKKGEDAESTVAYYSRKITEGTRGACVLAFAIMLDQKLGGNINRTYFHIFLPIVISHIILFLKGLLVDTIIAATNSNDIVKFFISVKTSLASKVVFGLSSGIHLLLLSLWMDGKNLNGYQVCAPSYVMSGAIVLCGIILLLSSCFPDIAFIGKTDPNDIQIPTTDPSHEFPQDAIPV